MKKKLQSSDVKFLKLFLREGEARDELRQALCDILTSDEISKEFDAEMGSTIANTCRDLALGLEVSDLYRAQRLMQLALAIRPSGPLLQQKAHEYERLLQVEEAGVTEINGISLAFGNSPPTPLLRALANGSYEQHEAKLLMEFIGIEDRVLELGAGIGYMGVLAMTYCKPQSYVAYEANPALLPYIRRNMELNGVWFQARNALLADEVGDREFYVTPAFWASSLLQPTIGEYEQVKVPAVDKNVVMAELKPTAMVVDIEGGEAEFFVGLDLTSVSKVLMEIHPAVLNDATLSALYAMLLKEGFMLHFKASSKAVLYWYR